MWNLESRRSTTLADVGDRRHPSLEPISYPFFRTAASNFIPARVLAALSFEQGILTADVYATIPIMAERIKLALEDIPIIPSRFRLQWEAAQNAHVLLYPEGMVKLSDSAAQILKRVDGIASVTAIIQDLERAFPGADLSSDVQEFLSIAHERGWIVISAPSYR
jgi:pyrroloquinoline quinone biosynthesis protein D